MVTPHPRNDKMDSTPQGSTQYRLSSQRLNLSPLNPPPTEGLTDESSPEKKAEDPPPPPLIRMMRKIFFSPNVREKLNLKWWSSFAVNASFTVNFLLLISKCVGLFLDFSMILLASALDSVLDLLSGTILWATHRLMTTRDKHNYPGGKSRFEPVGIIIFATVMATSSLQIVIISTINIIDKGSVPEEESAHFTSILIIVGVVIFIKLILFFLCRSIHTPFSQAYADDHRNDVMLNSLTLLVLFLISYDPSLRWLDDAGAIVIALYILFNWIKTGINQGKQLAAYTADEAIYSRLLLKIKDFAEDLVVQELKAYHFGPRLIVEILMTLPAEKKLFEIRAYTVGLKKHMETLESVERCFITVIYHNMELS